MFTVEQYNAIGKELEELLSLRFLPIAVKKLFSKDEIPEGCYQPSKERGEHPALCQAFAQVRRNKRSIAMFREDHWCLWPIIAFKDGEMTEDEQKASEKTIQDLTDKYIKEIDKAAEEKEKEIMSI